MRIILLAIVLGIAPVCAWALSQPRDVKERGMAAARAREITLLEDIGAIAVDPASEPELAPPEDIEEFEYVTTTCTDQFTVRTMCEHASEIVVNIFGVDPPCIPDGGSDAYQQASELARMLEQGRVFLELESGRSIHDQSTVKAWVWVRSGDGEHVEWDLLNLMYLARGRGAYPDHTPYDYDSRLLSSKYAAEVREVLDNGMDGYHELLAHREFHLCSAEGTLPSMDTGSSEYEYLHDVDIEVCHWPQGQDDQCIYEFIVSNRSDCDVHIVIEGEYVDGNASERIEFDGPTDYHVGVNTQHTITMRLARSVAESKSEIKWTWDVLRCPESHSD